MRSRASRSAIVALAGLFSACAGIFQRSLPDHPASYVRATVGGELCVGAAERDITPPVGQYLAGFSMARTSTGVASHLKARALVLRLADRQIAIVGIDNLGAMREDVDWIKSGLAGFANGDVFVCSSHTHAGPDLVGLWGFYLMSSGRYPEYVGALRKAVAEAVAEAAADAAPAELVQATALLPPQGLVKNANRPGVFDRRIRVLHAVARSDRRPLGTLLHMACHPEVLSRHNTELSADFVGELCDAWRARGLGQAVFVNGALGAMVSPAVKDRTIEGARQFGAGICDLAQAALVGGAPLPVDSIEVRRKDVYVPLRTLGLTLGRLACVIEREVYDGCARTGVGWLRIGDFTAVCVPGEMEPALAQRIRSRLGRPDLAVFGLCDDELGYLLRRQDARDHEFAYERSMSPCEGAGEMIEAALCGSPP